MDTPKKLYRSRTDKVIAGVCGGLGEYFNVDSLLFRIAFLVLIAAGGSGFWLYIILAILMQPAPLPGQPDQAVDPRERIHEVAAEIKDSAHRFAGEVRREERRRGHGRLWIGLIVVAAGVVALVNQLFPLPWIRWDTLWPVLLIVAGVLIVSRASQR